MKARRATTAMAVSVLTATMFIVAGCGGGADTSTGDNTGSGGDSNLARIDASVDTLLNGSGTYESPPTTAPLPKADTNVWLISCGQAYTACSVPIDAAEEAGQAMGWKTTVFDDKGDPTAAAAGIRNAVAQGADAIFLYYIDCRYIKGALEAAKAADVLVAGAEVFDCNYEDPNGPELFDYITTYSGGREKFPDPETDYETFISEFGKAQAEYAISKEKGEANMLVFGDDTGIGSKVVANAYVEELGECSGCEVNNITFPYSELTTGLRERASQELLKHPNTNSVASTYDAITLAGVASAVAASGKDILVIVGEGGPAGLELVRNGQGDAGAGLPLGWEAYAAMDALNRLLQGQEPVKTGIGLQLYDAEHNIPPTGGFRPPFDYAAIYQKAWKEGKG